MLRLLIAALALTPTFANAQVLWRNVEAGMPSSRVQQLYPAGDNVVHLTNLSQLSRVEQVGSCTPVVKIEYATGVVRSVIIDSRPASSGITCADEAQALLARRYGTPESTSEFALEANGAGRTVKYTSNNVAISFLRHGKSSGPGSGAVGSNLCLSAPCDAPRSSFGQRDDWRIVYRVAAPEPGVKTKEPSSPSKFVPPPLSAETTFNYLKSTVNEAGRFDQSGGPSLQDLLAGQPCRSTLTRRIIWPDGRVSNNPPQEVRWGSLGKVQKILWNSPKVRVVMYGEEGRTYELLAQTWDQASLMVRLIEDLKSQCASR